MTFANPKDPLANAAASQRELFARFSREADGFPSDFAVNAAANVILNALRQKHGSWFGAEREYDELFCRMKQLLSEHYTATGRKRGIFPYTQEIVAPSFNSTTKFHKA